MTNIDQVASFICWFNIVCVLLGVLLSVAFFTLFERKVIGAAQARIGPYNVGVGGILQPIVDALKLVVNYNISGVNQFSRGVLMNLGPVVFIIVACISWIAYPTIWIYVDCQTIMVYVVVVLALSVYGLVVIGWTGQSKYAVVGALRAVSQSISYEIVLVMALFSVIWTVSVVNFPVLWSLCSMCPIIIVEWVSFVICYVALLAESSRSPFDLSEGEAEIVAGWNVELGGQLFTLAFLSEQMGVVWSCTLLVSVFIDISLSWFNVLLMILLIVIVRVALPRMRFDNVIVCCWTQLLPLLVAVVVMYVLWVYSEWQILSASELSSENGLTTLWSLATIDVVYSYE